MEGGGAGREGGDGIVGAALGQPEPVVLAAPARRQVGKSVTDM